jgi:hypothetical protein
MFTTLTSAFRSSTQRNTQRCAFAHWRWLWRQTAVRSKPWWGRQACRWASLIQFVHWSCGWWSQMWRSWLAWLHGLRLWGQLNVLSNSLKWYRRLMVAQWTFNYLATALVDISAISMQIACFLNLWHFVLTIAHFSGLLFSPAQCAPM